MLSFRHFLKDQHGGPAIEFALVATFIAICFPAVMDITRLISNNMRLTGGLRAGEQYALKYPADTTGIAQAISTASNLPTDTVTAAVSQFCECAGISTTCGATCSGGVVIAKYAQITAYFDMTNQFNYNIYPATLSKSISVRIQ